MTHQTTYRKLNNQLTLHDPEGQPLTVEALTLALAEEGCRLTFEVAYELYSQRIDPNHLFHLERTARGPMMFAESFQADQPLRLECRLQNDCLPMLLEQSTMIDEIVAYLSDLNHHQPDHALLATENWVALSVKQAQGAVKVGYNANLPTDKVSPMSLAHLSERQKGSDENLATLVEQFLEMDEWPYNKINENSYRTGFYGENGQFSCYIQVRELEQQVLFYTVSAINVPSEQLNSIAEFVTRANYGMIIGNFELDWRDGELRYKTSIDIDGGQLNLALIKNLVYPNVMMMDRYLPGIMQVVYGNTPPEEALMSIEG